MTRTEGRVVLTVLPDFPIPADTGLHLRMMGNLDAVGRVAARSHVFWFSTDDRPAGTVSSDLLDAHCTDHRHAGPRVEQHKISRFVRAFAKVKFALGGALGLRLSSYPYSMRYDAALAADLIRSEVERVGADAVVLPSQGMHWRVVMPEGVEVIIDAADVLTDVTRRLAETHEGSSIGRLGLWANHLACRSQERLHLGAVSEVWATTAAEAERFAEIAPGCSVVVVPNTVKSPERGVVVASDTARISIGILGTWSYRPNLDALDRLLERIVPRLIADDIDFEVMVGGRDLPADRARRIAQDHRMTALGKLDDVAAFYATVDIVALPIEVRGGVPLKLAEALAWAKPVVATPALVAGLALSHGEHLLVARDDDDFARCIARLAGDPNERTRIALAGVSAHTELFSAAAIDSALDAGSVLCRP